MTPKRAIKAEERKLSNVCSICTCSSCCAVDPWRLTVLEMKKAMVKRDANMLPYSTWVPNERRAVPRINGEKGKA